MQRNTQDIILITGRNSTGKTTAYNVLRNSAEVAGRRFLEHPIHDFNFMLLEVIKDDAQGGLHHYHEWSTDYVKGHTHKKVYHSEPFVVLDNRLIENAFKNFFQYIYALPQDGTIKFVMWAGGTNLLDERYAAHGIEYSYRKALDMFAKKVIPQAIFKRVLAVINVEADEISRGVMNAKKIDFTENDATYSYKSPRKMDEVLHILGGDDFPTLYEGLQKYGVGNIITVRNNGQKEFLRRMELISGLFFSENSIKTTRKIHNIVFLGKAAAGKTELISDLENLFYRNNIETEIMTERISIEMEVLQDKAGKHSKLVTDGKTGKRIFTLKDDILIDRAEEKRIEFLLQQEVSDKVVITEFVLCTKAKKRFIQNGQVKDSQYFIDWIKEKGLLENTLFIEIDSQFYERAGRHIKRDDSYDIDNFIKFYSDDIPQAREVVPGSSVHYFKFTNYNKDRKSRKFFADFLFRRCIYPLILGIKL